MASSPTPIDRKRAETQTLGRDCLLSPWAALVGLMAGITGVLCAHARWKV